MMRRLSGSCAGAEAILARCEARTACRESNCSPTAVCFSERHEIIQREGSHHRVEDPQLSLMIAATGIVNEGERHARRAHDVRERGRVGQLNVHIWQGPRKDFDAVGIVAE